MSNELVSVSARLKSELERNRAVLPASSANYITADSGKFVLPNGLSNPTISLIIFDFRRVFTFYKSAFNPKLLAKPECFAIGFDEKVDMRSNVLSPKPQSGEVCGNCPQNQWKSGASGGKRCKNGIKLAVLPPGDFSAKSVLTLTLPPTSLKNFTSYTNALSAKGLHYAQVVTTLSFDPEVAYSKFEFEQTGVVDDLERLNEAYSVATPILESIDAYILSDD